MESRKLFHMIKAYTHNYIQNRTQPNSVLSGYQVINHKASQQDLRPACSRISNHLSFFNINTHGKKRTLRAEYIDTDRQIPTPHYRFTTQHTHRRKEQVQNQWVN